MYYRACLHTFVSPSILHKSPSWRMGGRKVNKQHMIITRSFVRSQNAFQIPSLVALIGKVRYVFAGQGQTKAILERIQLLKRANGNSHWAEGDLA